MLPVLGALGFLEEQEAPDLELDPSICFLAIRTLLWFCVSFKP